MRVTARALSLQRERPVSRLHRWFQENPQFFEDGVELGINGG
ncbi:hypothetical protein [Nocardiopsis sp. Huas11]|nr:hypothetical protein [Nocardiopsis sp. Huas11]